MTTLVNYSSGSQLPSCAIRDYVFVSCAEFSPQPSSLGQDQIVLWILLSPANSNVCLAPSALLTMVPWQLQQNPPQLEALVLSLKPTLSPALLVMLMVVPASGLWSISLQPKS